MLASAIRVFAQDVPAPESDVVINPDPAPVSDTGSQAAAGIGIGLTILFLVFGIISLVFFIIAIIHLVKNPDVPNRTLWIILSIFVPFASWVYVLGPRRSYNKNGGASKAAPSQLPQRQASQWQNPAAASTGAASAPAQPFSSQPSQEIPQPTPFTPPTVSSPPPPVSAAPPNPVQAPPAPTQPEPFQSPPSLDNQNDPTSTPTVPTPPVTFPGETGSGNLQVPHDQDRNQYPPRPDSQV